MPTHNRVNQFEIRIIGQYGTIKHNFNFEFYSEFEFRKVYIENMKYIWVGLFQLPFIKNKFDTYLVRSHNSKYTISNEQRRSERL